MPEATYTALPTTPTIPPTAPSTSEASITIFSIEFRVMIQQYLRLLPPLEPDIPRPSNPIAPTKEAIPTEESTRADVTLQPTQEVAIEPSSPPESPAT
ncbi:hypothetical protein CK203_114947 [Vitis vinifera]|uniref:Uncharacterized protein n=1 Tax=Vitis vinifera TaxID=29760 RepID=A0A438CSA7_VITVI|nr:hypothetical protein CK203_114947 [Vitis vinifera]